MLDFGFYNMDCMEGMKQFPDDFFDLAIVDPPYGIDITKMNMGSRNTVKPNKDKKWDTGIPKKEYFDELFRVSKNQIIWGENYFTELIPPSQYFAIWDKGETMYGRDFAECEFAWVRKGGTRIKKINPNNKQRIHPTQKPIALYEWLLSRYAKPNDIILDTHAGSASSLIACHKTNHKFVGFELDAEYFEKANRRLQNEIAQMTLFDFGVNPYQE